MDVRTLGPIREGHVFEQTEGEGVSDPLADHTAAISKEASDKGSSHRERQARDEQPGRPLVASTGTQEAGDRVSRGGGGGGRGTKS